MNVTSCYKGIHGDQKVAAKWGRMWTNPHFENGVLQVLSLISVVSMSTIKYLHKGMSLINAFHTLSFDLSSLHCTLCHLISHHCIAHFHCHLRTLQFLFHDDDFVLL